LEGMFKAMGVEAQRREVELPDSAIAQVVVKELVANRQDVVGAQLIVKPRAKIGAGAGTRDSLAQRCLGERGAQNKSGDHRVILNVAAEKREEKRGFLAERTPNAPVEKLRMIARFLRCEWVPRIEN